MARIAVMQRDHRFGRAVAPARLGRSDHLARTPRVGPQPSVDRKLTLAHDAVNQSAVALLDVASAQLGIEVTGRLEAVGEQQAPRGVAVETVHDA